MKISDKQKDFLYIATGFFFVAVLWLLVAGRLFYKRPYVLDVDYDNGDFSFVENGKIKLLNANNIIVGSDDVVSDNKEYKIVVRAVNPVGTAMVKYIDFVVSFKDVAIIQQTRIDFIGKKMSITEFKPTTNKF
jgi:hypothetical protein